MTKEAGRNVFFRAFFREEFENCPNGSEMSAIFALPRNYPCRNRALPYWRLQNNQIIGRYLNGFLRRNSQTDSKRKVS